MQPSHIINKPRPSVFHIRPSIVLSWSWHARSTKVVPYLCSVSAFSDPTWATSAVFVCSVSIASVQLHSTQPILPSLLLLSVIIPRICFPRKMCELRCYVSLLWHKTFSRPDAQIATLQHWPRFTEETAVDNSCVISLRRIFVSTMGLITVVALSSAKQEVSRVAPS